MSKVIFFKLSINIGNLKVRPVLGKPCIFEDAAVGPLALLGTGGNDHRNVAMLSKKCLVRSDTRVAR